MIRSLLGSTIVFLGAFIVQSCNMFLDDNPGTGTITVTMNGTKYHLVDVTGTEYLGFYCGGKISGKRMELALGAHPQTGDTIIFAGQNNIAYGEYSLYDHNFGLPGSGHITVTKRSGSVLTGSFHFDVIDGNNDTIRFRNGTFTVDFKPSR